MLNHFDSGITPADDTSILISVDAWNRGQRPAGYQETSGAIREAHSLDIRLSQLLSSEEMSRWNELVAKARVSSLGMRETKEIIALSIKINQVIEVAKNSRSN